MERIILSQLSHPLIVGFHFACQDTFSLYFGLEFCPRGDLAEFIHNNKSSNFGLRVDLGTHYAAEVLSALIYLHSNEIIHGDLKPENILIAEDRHIR